jgi:hypothetical protein
VDSITLRFIPTPIRAIHRKGKAYVRLDEVVKFLEINASAFRESHPSHPEISSTLRGVAKALQGIEWEKS